MEGPDRRRRRRVHPLRRKAGGVRAVAIRAVLTPHSGEVARLLGITSERGRGRPLRRRRASLAKRARAIVVLKGASTLIASPSGRVVVNPSGRPALATAGSGDMLAGIVGALPARSLRSTRRAPPSSCMALAGDAWSAKHGDRGLLASEIADQVPGVLAAFARATRR